MWKRKAARFCPPSSSSSSVRTLFSSTAKAASHNLAAPQREASHAAASSAAPPAEMLETMRPVPFGDIAYGTSEWFWIRRAADGPGHLDKAFRIVLRNWEGCNCPKTLLPSQWRDRVVQMRQQGSLPEALAGEPLTVNQHIAAAAEALRTAIATMSRPQLRLPAHALCVKRTAQNTDAQDRLNLQGETTKLEAEAKEEALNLASYRFQSRLVVFAYWCSERRQRERKAKLMKELV